jgi:hypothetical protein
MSNKKQIKKKSNSNSKQIKLRLMKLEKKKKLVKPEKIIKLNFRTTQC